MSVQFIEIGGQKMAMLPLDEFHRLRDACEDQADLRDAALAELRMTEGEEYLPAALVDQLLAGENALRVWRKHRGMTLEGLSNATGVVKSMLSNIENGKRSGTAATWRALAAALNVTVDDILPAE
ncbi:MAG: helix-turn-helix transcriptional regulator [Novosphingobium sp.]